jgi:intracellular septation protein
MQALFDLLPAVVFFLTYRFFGIYAATAAIMATMALQLAYQWLRHRKVAKLFLATAIVVWVFGAITLFLRNPLFIQWKPTIVSWFFAVAFLGSHFVGQRKTLVERAMGEAFELEPALGRQLSAMWIVTFAAIGALNLYIVYHFSEQLWVDFKVFGITGITLLVALVQGVWVYFKSAKRDPQQEP